MISSYVDGVPTLRIPAPGPVRACLRFGVGARDETYSTLGVGRAVAALATIGCPTGQVAPDISAGLDETRFSVSGSLEDVGACLKNLCLALSGLPVDRFGEATDEPDFGGAGTFDPRVAAALNARYGSQAEGLPGHVDVLLRPPAAESVLRHAATWFTRTNAVLTWIGPEPAGLRLPLPQGPTPHRTAPQARHSRASWTHRNINGVALSVEMPAQSAAASAAHRILRARVAAALPAGQSGPAETESVTTVHDSATLVRLLLAPASAADAHNVAATLWSQALFLADKEPTSAEVAHHGAPTRESAQPTLATFDAAARAVLFDTPHPRNALNSEPDGPRPAPEAVTPAHVRAAWRQALQGAQLVVPPGLLLDFAAPDGRRLWCTSCWTWDESAPWGRTFREPPLKRAVRRSARTQWAVLTDESLVSCRPGAHHELRFDDVLALERHGSDRALIGICGCTIGISPSWYRGGQQLVRAIDNAVSADLTFDCAD
ncbi:hypothetical protein GTY65_00535 [Streptomyces sp. SID8379]|uniref:hypothetical protein n=1 Tax=unclassified Streptomyces TaxID=2593676 RepID=UPI00035D8CDE|nr:MULTISPECIES: hypothetical protein [unclassified Streptomyces]MYW62573.1 hypothetical protein [Streptomyces sp. SID8379]